MQLSTADFPATYPYISYLMRVGTVTPHSKHSQARARPTLTHLFLLPKELTRHSLTHSSKFCMILLQILRLVAFSACVFYVHGLRMELSPRAPGGVNSRYLYILALYTDPRLLPAMEM